MCIRDSLSSYLSLLVVYLLPFYVVLLPTSFVPVFLFIPNALLRLMSYFLLFPCLTYDSSLLTYHFCICLLTSYVSSSCLLTSYFLLPTYCFLLLTFFFLLITCCVLITCFAVLTSYFFRCWLSSHILILSRS